MLRTHLFRVAEGFCSEYFIIGLIQIRSRLQCMEADIGNAYLEAFTDEKLFIVAGPEFQELEGYIYSYS